jgi:hypothetical protein
VGRVLLAHDAAQVAEVRVRVEGDAPRPRGGARAWSVSAHDPLVELLDVADVRFDVGDVARGAEQVAAEPSVAASPGSSTRRCICCGERGDRAMLEEKAVDLVLDVLGHAADVGRDHRDARLLRLVDHEGRVLDPDRRDDDRVAVVEDVGRRSPGSCTRRATRPAPRRRAGSAAAMPFKASVSCPRAGPRCAAARSRRACRRRG